MDMNVNNSKVSEIDGYFLIVPVKRNSVSQFAIKNNELKTLKKHMISVDKKICHNYLLYFLWKYFDKDLIENKIKMESDDYKENCTFELSGKNNFYTLDYINLMKEDIEELSKLLKTDYESGKLEEYKKVLFKRLKVDENYFKENIDVIIEFYNDIIVYFNELLTLDENKYIISFIEY